MSSFLGSDSQNKGSELERLSNEATSKLEIIAGDTIELKDYYEKIGTGKDNKQFREKLKKRIEATRTEIMNVKALITSIEGLNLDNKSEIAKKSKLEKRLNEMFNEHLKNFTETATEITRKESQVVGTIRKISQDGKNRGLNDAEILQEQQRINASLVEVDMNEEMINERQKEIEEIVKDISVNIAAEVQKQEMGLEIIVDNVKSTKKNTKEANKDLDQVGEYKQDQKKKACYLFLMILVVCGVVTASIVLFAS